MDKKRFMSFLLFLFSIALGLLSRSSIVDFPEFLRTYSGDTIWGMMVFFMFRTLFPKAHTKQIILYSVLFSFSIEFSQTFHPEWLDSIRSIKLFALILGHDFIWSDLLCYSTGILVGNFINFKIIRPKI